MNVSIDTNARTDIQILTFLIYMKGIFMYANTYTNISREVHSHTYTFYYLSDIFSCGKMTLLSFIFTSLPLRLDSRERVKDEEREGA